MRLDRFLCEMNMGTRNQVKAYIRRGLVTVNGAAADRPDSKVDEAADRICFRGNVVKYRKYIYYMMNKPAGVISARTDSREETVLSLLGSGRRDDISPVGRLDKDTTGLLLLTNDGELAHYLLSPGRHVDKTYHVTAEHPLTPEEIGRLEEGVEIGEDRPTLPARAEVLPDGRLSLTIREGKFHQVKRMLHAVGNSVLALERVSFGGLELDENLKPGEYRELTEAELEILRYSAGITV